MQQFAAREIGARIAQARREAGRMTQEQLAELLNVSTRSVQDYEGGITIPWRHFQRLEEIFKGRSMGWFLHGEDGEEVAAGDRFSRVEEQLEETRAHLRRIEELVRALRPEQEPPAPDPPRARRASR